MLANPQTVEIVNAIKDVLTQQQLEYRPHHRLFFMVYLEPNRQSVIHEHALLERIGAILDSQRFPYDSEDLPPVVAELRNQFRTVHVSESWKAQQAY